MSNHDFKLHKREFSQNHFNRKETNQYADDKSRFCFLTPKLFLTCLTSR